MTTHIDAQWFLYSLQQIIRWGRYSGRDDVILIRAKNGAFTRSDRIKAATA